MATKKFPTWLDKPIVKEDHAQDLENKAAIYEFGHGIPREDAEEQAYREYKEDHHRQAAAHHLRGKKAAMASGDNEEAHKHDLLYQLHLKHLGHDQFDGTPEDIRALAEADDRDINHRFKAHHGDRLLLG